MRTLPILFVTTVLALAQEPFFEVVSVRVVPPNAPPLLRSQHFNPVQPGGRYIDQRTSLMSLIAFAFDVKNPSKQLHGLPDWTKHQSYSVAGQPAPNFKAASPAKNREQVRIMLRNMLAERFKLKVHTETRQDRVYALKISKGGVKIPQTNPPGPPDKEGFVNMAAGDESGRIVATKGTMSGIARSLSTMLDRPTIDATGLTGFYNIDIQWRTPVPPDAGARTGGLGTEGIGLLISALEDQLGLRLESTKAPVEHWIVDHVEPPTEN